MQDYKVQHPSKQTQIIFPKSQRIITVLIIMKKLGTIRKKFSGIQSDHLTNAFKKSNVILAQKQPKI